MIEISLCIIFLQLLSLSATINNLVRIKQKRVLRRIRRQQLLMSQYLNKFVKTKKRRSMFKMQRLSKSWEDDVLKFTDLQFKNNFRISRTLFYELVAKLTHLKAIDTKFRLCVPLEKRVAIALYALGSSAEYRTMSNLFGVGRSTVGEILMDVCEELCNVLNDAISTYPPTQTSIEYIRNGFEEMGFPQCFGAVDGTHIEIHPKANEAIDYYNYKGWYSIILLAAVDHRCKFTYVNIGSPGRNNDGGVFNNSLLLQQHKDNTIFYEHTKEICGVEVPMLLIGDSAFKLSNFLMKPYPYAVNQLQKEKLFNYHLSKCRRVVENAFGILKARFRRLGKGIDNSIDNAPVIIKACCLLHNFIISHNESIPNEWLEDTNIQNLQPQTTSSLGNNNESAKNIRDAIAQYIYEKSRLDDN